MTAVAAGMDVVAHHHRHGGRDVELLEALAAASLGEAGLDLRLVSLLVVGRGEEDRQPAVGDLGRQLDVLGADGGQVDGQVRPAVDDALERLAQAGGVGAGVGHLVVLALMHQRLLAARRWCARC